MKAAAVIGGGASLHNFDFDRLRGLYRIGVNKSAWRAPCDAFVTMDGRFETAHSAQIMGFSGMKVSAGLVRDPIPGVVRCARGPDTGLSETWNYLHGDNSGHAALNVAVLLGFKLVYLLGFDMKNDAHWHGGYPQWRNSRMSRHREAWAAALDGCRPLLDSLGITVLNVTKPGVSALTAFPEIPLDATR